MAWTNPKTWTASPLPSAELNTYVRDNTNLLKTAIHDNGHPLLPVVQTKSANYTALVTDDVIYCHTNAFTVTLYSLASGLARTLWVVNDFVNTGTITIDGASSELVENNTTYAVPPGARVCLFATSGAWLILSRCQEPSILPRCSVYNGATQTHASSGSWVALTFNSEDFDVGAMHSTSSNTSRITIPNGFGGTYLVGGATTFPGTNATLQPVGIRVRKNGSSLVGSAAYQSEYGNGIQGIQVVTPCVLGEGDYIELEAFQLTGASLAFGASGAARDDQSSFWAVKQVN